MNVMLTRHRIANSQLEDYCLKMIGLYVQVGPNSYQLLFGVFNLKGRKTLYCIHHMFEIRVDYKHA